MEQSDVKPAPIGPELRRYGRMIYRQRWWVIGTTLVTTAVSLAITAMGGDVAPAIVPAIAPSPTAGATVVAPPNARIFIRPPTELTGQEAIDIATHAALIDSTDVARSVRDQLDLEVPIDEILEKVSVAPQPPSQIIHIYYQDSDQALAQRVGRSFGASYIQLLEKEDRAILRNRMTLLQRQSRALEARSSDSSAVLGRQIALQEQLIAAEIALQSIDRGRIIETEDSSTPVAAPEMGSVDTPASAAISGGPSRLKRNGAAGLLLGLLLGIAVALTRETLDDRLVTQRLVEQTLDIPVLLRYQHIPDPNDPGFTRVFAIVENLMEHRKVLVVTGLAADEVIRDTARAIWEAGRDGGARVTFTEDPTDVMERPLDADLAVIAAPGYMTSPVAARLAAKDVAVLLVIDGRATRAADATKAFDELRLSRATPLGILLYRAEEY